MAKGKKNGPMSRSDKKHLHEFGEMHPADVESALMKNQRKEDIISGAFKVSCNRMRVHSLCKSFRFPVKTFSAREISSVALM